MSEVPEVICGAKAAHCICVLAPHDDATAHRCVPDCGGSWREIDGRFEPIVFPGSSPPFPGCRS